MMKKDSKNFKKVLDKLRDTPEWDKIIDTKPEIILYTTKGNK